MSANIQPISTTSSNNSNQQLEYKICVFRNCKVRGNNKLWIPLIKKFALLCDEHAVELLNDGLVETAEVEKEVID